MNSEHFVETDESRAFFVSLKQLSAAIWAIENDPAWFQWAIVGAHATAQTAMVLHLSGTTNLGALRKDAASAMLEYSLAPLDCQRHFARPVERMAPFNELLQRLSQRECWDRFGGPVSLPDDLRDTLVSLNDDRNDAVHFLPKSWAFSRQRLAVQLNAVVRLIWIIEAEPSKWAFRRLYEAWDEVEEEIAKIEAWTNPHTP